MVAIFAMQDSSDAAAATAAIAGGMITLVILALTVVAIAGMWKVFSKAGEPGWAAIVPIYNIIVMLKIAGKPMWWFILMLLPFINLVVLIIVALGIATNFGKSTGFGLGLAFLGPIFYPILGFGTAQYQPKAA